MSEADKKLCSVVVSSIDSYEDAWQPFFTLFFRYWPDNPYPLYLVTNHKNYPDKRVVTIKVGGGNVWGTNIRRALSQINTPYLIWFLEDFFLEKPVDTAYIQQLIDYMIHTKVACIHLSPLDPHDEDFPNPLRLGKLSKNAPYRTSLRTAIWDKKIFTSLIHEGESAWDMELLGTERSREIEDPFLSVIEPAVSIHSRAAIRGGKWLYDSIKIFKKEGIKLDLSNRPVDFEGKIKSVLNKVRVTRLAQRMKKTPVVGRILLRLFKRLFSVKVNRLLNRSERTRDQ